MMKLQPLAKSLLLASGVAVASNAAIAAPVIRGNYYEENVQVICNAASTCTAVFTAAANNARVSIESLSCSIVTGAANVRLGIFGRSAAGVIQRAQFLLPEFVAKAGNQNQYLINTPATLDFENGEKPAIRIVAASSTSLNLACQIVGRFGTFV